MTEFNEFFTNVNFTLDVNELNTQLKNITEINDNLIFIELYGFFL